MKRNLYLLTCLLFAMQTAAQSLSITWSLDANNVEPGIVQSTLTITNNTNETLTADGTWLIGGCWMSVHPYDFDRQELYEDEVCASYHTFRPSPDFRPLAPGETHDIIVRQRGSILRENAGPQGLFFIAEEGAQPIDITLDAQPFSAPQKQATTGRGGYADGPWLFDYNAQFCKVLPSAFIDDKQVADWYRALHMIPMPKQVSFTQGSANLQGTVVEKTDKNLPAEGYRLTIGDKKILIQAADSAGFFYAHETLERLRENGERLPCLTITDYPDLAHRGLMIDIARNYTPKQEIMKILDAMASYKLNVFHFHIADDEAWRLEIPGLPELTEIGSRRGYTSDESQCLYPAYNGGWDPEAKTSANGYLSREDYIDLVRYAQQLHIRVIPEIDMPGHSRAAIRAMEARYQRLLPVSEEAAWEYRLADPDDRSEYSSAQHYTDDVICIAMPSCYRFVEKVIHEVAAMHEEAGQPLTVWHAGGDEVAKGAWTQSPICQKYMEENGISDLHQLKDMFIERILEILRPMGIKIAGWEEIAMRGGEVNSRFAGDDVISWCWNSIPEWRGDEKPYLLANAGYPVVLACVGNLYVDMCCTNHHQERGLHWGGYTDEHSTFDFLPYDIYRSVRYDMRRQVRDIQQYDADKTLRLSSEAQPRIYGLQGQLFAETIRSSEQLEEYIFPRLQGIAERGWNATPISYQRAYSAEGVKTRTTGGKTTYSTPSAVALHRARQAFEVERLSYSQQLYSYELPRISRWGFRFHLPQPGISIKQDKGNTSAFQMAGFGSALAELVIINNPVENGSIVRYTTDGSEPTAQSPIYQRPFPKPANAVIKAKTFYLGMESNTTMYIEQ